MVSRTLEITTVKSCSINCYPHCPQMKFRAALGNQGNILDFGDFCKAMVTVPQDVSIEFSGFAEPFLNGHALDMIEYAKMKGHKVSLFSTLVGLNPDGVRKLKSIGLDHFSLHLPDNLGIAHIPITATYKETLGAALELLRIDDYSRMDENFVTNERAGNCDNVKPRRVFGPFYCGKLVVPQVVMLPNCEVVLCCMDWTLRHRLGNLLESSYNEIISSREFARISKQRWNFLGDTLCRSCKWAVPLHIEAALRIGRALQRRLRR